MTTVTVYKLNASDTKAIRAALKDAGLTVHHCRLSADRWSADVHTDDNVSAVNVLAERGYMDACTWSTPAQRREARMTVHKASRKPKGQ